jgi:hypothetical protein
MKYDTRELRRLYTNCINESALFRCYTRVMIIK